MSQEPEPVKGISPKVMGVDVLSRARAWVGGDRSFEEPFLSATQIVHLLKEDRGRGMDVRKLLSLAELGEITAYRDTSRGTRWGGHPTVFRWSEVRPVLLGRGHGIPSRIVRIIRQAGSKWGGPGPAEAR